MIGFAFLLMLPALSYGIGLEVAVGGWQQNPKGTLGFKPDPLIDSSIDLENEANYGDEIKPFGRVKIDMPLVLPNIYLMATPMEFEETGRKSAQFSFGDVTFDGGVDFQSKLQLNHYDVCLFYGLPFLETASLEKLNVEVGLNVRIVDIEARVSQQTFVQLEESTSETFYIPMIFLAAQFRPIESLGLEVEGRGIGYSDNAYYDIIARIRYKIFGPMAIAAGWRYEKLEIDEEDVLANVEFSGPFGEIVFTF